MKQEDFSKKLRAHIVVTHGTISSAAAHWAVSQQYVSAVLSGRRTPTERMLDDMGVERKVQITYVKKEKK